MSGLAAFEGELNYIVKEYLEHIAFQSTVETFENECTKNGKSIAPIESRSKGNQKMIAVQNEMMQLFSHGKRKEFLRLWLEYLPSTVRDSDSVALKLEFYIMIHFATFSLRQGKDTPDDNMEALKKYLESRGAALGQTPEFLSYFALPYISNIRTHPSYKELFSDSWVPDLESKISKFLSTAFQSNTFPHLLNLYQNAGKDRQQQQADQRLVDTERRLASYQRKCKQLQADYQNIISITADLVDTLEATVNGELVSADYLQKICERLFSTQVRQTVDLTRPGTASAMLRQSAVPPQGLQHHDVSPAVVLDYDKIKYHLVSGEERKQALLLQALRWKLSKVPRAERDAMMSAYVKNDLLGCARQGPHRQAVLSLLFPPSSEVVQQYATRLLNAFSSLSAGRAYLCQNVSLVPALISTLRHTKIDSLTCENSLGALQKLSLRRQMQSVMIEENIIEWLVQVLEDFDGLSDYTLEYSIALLMNLCLRTAGKRKCIEIARQVLKVLTDLLGHDNKEIIPYVNGALYSVLAITSIRSEAKLMGVEDILRCNLKDDQPDMNRQIEFIIKQLNSTNEPVDAESDDEEEEDDEEDQDVMEADLDKDEVVRVQSGELQGDRLLNSYYVQASGGVKKKRPTDPVSTQDGVLSRPVTPGVLRGTNDAHAVVYRPPTGKASHHSSSRADIQRPPTRSGSRPSSAQESMDSRGSSAMDLKSPDVDAKEGRRTAHGAVDNRVLKPSTKAMEKLTEQAVNLAEYGEVFGTRARIPRTPDVGAGRPTSRGTMSEGPPPQPKYSDSLPTPRPSSEGKRMKSQAMPPPTQQNAWKASTGSKPK